MIDDGGVPAPTGFVFDAATPAALQRCVLRAVALRRDAAAWRSRMAAAMGQSLSWRGPASEYLALYETAAAARRTTP